MIGRRDDIRKKAVLAGSLLIAAASLYGSGPPAIADPFNSDAVPPDVTVPLVNPAAAAPAPSGSSPATNASAAGSAYGSASPSFSSNAQGMRGGYPINGYTGLAGHNSTPPGVPVQNINGVAGMPPASPNISPNNNSNGNPGQVKGISPALPISTGTDTQANAGKSYFNPGSLLPASAAGASSAGPPVLPSDCPGCDMHKQGQSADTLVPVPVGGGNVLMMPIRNGGALTNPGGAGNDGNNTATTAISNTSTAAAAMRDPLAVIQTTKGPITVRLFRQYAPNTVANFLDLVQRGFYNNLTWHRIAPGFVIQTGCPKGDGSGSFVDPVTNRPRMLPLELNPHLRHNAAGVVAMARFGNDPDSASSQFYITLSPQPHLDNKYAIFGGVVNGMDAVSRITQTDRILSISVQN